MWQFRSGLSFIQDQIISNICILIYNCFTKKRNRWRQVCPCGRPMKFVLDKVSRCFKNFLQNFGDLSQFWWFWWSWYRLQNFEKSLSTFVRPYWDQFWKILTFEFGRNRKVMINHRGGILIFCQNLSKLKILDFRVKDLKFCDFVKFWILGLRISNFRFSSKFSSNLFNFDQKLKFCGLGLRISNFDFRLGLRISNFTNLPKSKFYKNHQILSKKFLISQIFCGF